VNLNTAVTSTALILAWRRTRVARFLEVLAAGEVPGVRWDCQRRCKALRKDTRREQGKQEFGRRWGASSMRHSFFLHQVRRAES